MLPTLNQVSGVADTYEFPMEPTQVSVDAEPDIIRIINNNRTESENIRY